LEIPPMLILCGKCFCSRLWWPAFFSKTENIFWNGWQSGFLECNIIDNGKGLNAHKQSKYVSRGIAFGQERSFYYSLQIWIPSIHFTENDGTTLRSDWLFKEQLVWIKLLGFTIYQLFLGQLI
jgi:hypothetical protein